MISKKKHLHFDSDKFLNFRPKIIVFSKKSLHYNFGTRNWRQNQSEDFTLVFTLTLLCSKFFINFLFQQTSQNLGKTHCPPNFFGLYAYVHIAAMSRVGIETQRYETETRPRLRKTYIETSTSAEKYYFLKNGLHFESVLDFLIFVHKK